jgi:hypothetical protein
MWVWVRVRVFVWAETSDAHVEEEVLFILDGLCRIFVHTVVVLPSNTTARPQPVGG